MEGPWKQVASGLGAWGRDPEKPGGRGGDRWAFLHSVRCGHPCASVTLWTEQLAVCWQGSKAGHSGKTSEWPLHGRAGSSFV